MTTAQRPRANAHAPFEAGCGADATRCATSPAPTSRLRPGWPLTAVLIGYPVWWLLGVAEIIPFVAAVVMAVQLRRRGGFRARRGFGIWMLFLAWAAAGVLMLQVDAPGAVPGGSTTRYFTYGFRYSWYLTATITMLYVYSMRSQLSTTRLARAFGCLFLSVTAGGVVGTLAPTTSFPSLIEAVLPHNLANAQSIHDLVHPVFAQLYSVGGVLNPRTSAPFAYTNDWGLNFACLLPFFLFAWFGPEAGRRRRMAPLVLVIAAYPVIKSENQGLWLALLVCGGATMLRLAMLRNLRMLLLLAGTAALAAVLFSVVPVGSAIEHRTSGSSSEDTRTNLASRTVHSVINGSPITGFGSTRNVQGSFYSIAGGDTADCTRCSPPALGTQGHFWLLIFSTGVGGLILYLTFLLHALTRSFVSRSPVVTLAMSVITMHLVTMFVYDTIGIALVTIFAAVALLWVEQERLATGFDHGTAAVGAWATLLRRNAAVLLICLLLAGGGAVVWRQVRGVATNATTTVIIGPKGAALLDTNREQSLDTIARLLDSAAVLRAVSEASDLSPQQARARLTATAAPNSRVLHVHFVDARPHVARAAANVAARELITVRSGLLRREQRETLGALDQLSRGIRDSLVRLDAQIASAKAGLERLASTREALLHDANDVADRIARVGAISTGGGVINSYGRVHAVGSAWLVSVVSAELIGLAVGVTIAYGRSVRGRRIGRRATRKEVGGMPVLARLSGSGATVLASDADRRASEVALRRLERTSSTPVVLGMPDDLASIEAARRLESGVGGLWPDVLVGDRRAPAIALVAGPSTRDREIAVVCRQIRGDDGPEPWLILIGQRLGRRPSRAQRPTRRHVEVIGRQQSDQAVRYRAECPGAPR